MSGQLMSDEWGESDRVHGRRGRDISGVIVVR